MAIVNAPAAAKTPWAVRCLFYISDAVITAGATGGTGEFRLTLSMELLWVISQLLAGLEGPPEGDDYLYEVVQAIPKPAQPALQLKTASRICSRLTYYSETPAANNWF